jgi:hypothetical protein
LAQVSNPSYFRGQDQDYQDSRPIWAKRSPDSISVNEKLDVVISACPSNDTGSVNRRIVVQVSPGIKEDTILKITNARMAGVVQVVGYLLSRHAGPDLHLQNHKKKKKKKKNTPPETKPHNTIGLGLKSSKITMNFIKNGKFIKKPMRICVL